LPTGEDIASTTKAMMARTATIATAIISSISVKPRSGRRARARSSLRRTTTRVGEAR
jgi:hypothetical protein